MKKGALLALMFLMMISSLLLIQPPSAYACSCANSEPDEAFERADTVFSGTVLRTKAEYKREGRTATFGYRDANLLEVQEAWKGVEQSQLLVYDPGHESSCGMNFEEGQTYLVYAYDVKGELHTSYCSRTIELSRAGEDLSYLGAGHTTLEKVNLKGKMRWVIGRELDRLVFGGGALVVIGGVAALYLLRRLVRRKR
ncbi:hypothetical protein [Paenibacillus sp. 1P07SE]|uniref:hypothetical protein n=1 Tax=Paenibacillus sp. 1P07SE TaxID=3132209 RepID=UPI0039A76FD2